MRCGTSPSTPSSGLCSGPCTGCRAAGRGGVRAGTAPATRSSAMPACAPAATATCPPSAVLAGSPARLPAHSRRAPGVPPDVGRFVAGPSAISEHVVACERAQLAKCALLAGHASVRATKSELWRAGGRGAPGGGRRARGARALGGARWGAGRRPMAGLWRCRDAPARQWLALGGFSTCVDRQWPAFGELRRARAAKGQPLAWSGRARCQWSAIGAGACAGARAGGRKSGERPDCHRGAHRKLVGRAARAEAYAPELHAADRAPTRSVGCAAMNLPRKASCAGLPASSRVSSVLLHRCIPV
jgi:hypothetical protein